MLQENLKLLAEIDRLKCENEVLKKDNKEKEIKIKNQANSLSVAQNSLKIKNEKGKQMTTKISELEQNLKKFNGNNDKQLILNLRKKIQQLNDKIRQEDAKYFGLLGKCKILEEKAEVEKKKVSNLTREFEDGKQKMITEHENEKQELEALYKAANEKLRKNLETDRSSKEIDEDMWKTCVEQLNYIESLKRKIEDSSDALRMSSQKEKEVSSVLLKAKEELNKVQEEKRLLIQQMNILNAGNKKDLEDTTCLICRTDMNDEETNFHSLPKCDKCQRRYHTDCLSQWFGVKKECPVCRSPEITNIRVHCNVEANINVCQIKL